MDTDELLNLINIALNEAEIHVVKYYDNDERPMRDTNRVLSLLKKYVQNSPTHINERVLRAMHDIGAMAVKSYENTNMDDAIGNIISFLYRNLPEYKKLTPLRMDFGKGDPI